MDHLLITKHGDLALTINSYDEVVASKAVRSNMRTLPRQPEIPKKEKEREKEKE
jgi:hypothetical protein